MRPTRPLHLIRLSALLLAAGVGLVSPAAAATPQKAAGQERLDLNGTFSDDGARRPQADLLGGSVERP